MLFSASGAPLALWHPRPVRSRALMRGLWLCLVEEIDFVAAMFHPKCNPLQ